jgi:hypothetical protein
MTNSKHTPATSKCGDDGLAETLSHIESGQPAPTLSPRAAKAIFIAEAIFAVGVALALMLSK